ncbi:hypothetical protein HYV10_00135 [Candidatus Dependentiae bacterium]|nr:hypothetical protein [Candidatus Dependentiae bacterium]
MDLQHLLEGYIIGFSVGTTIGISGVLCLQNMMVGRVSLGLTSVIAAALSDLSCGILALYGMQFIEIFLIKYQKGLNVVAGLLLCFLGLKRLFEKTIFIPGYQPSKNLLVAFFSIYFLGMIDPVSVLDFLALAMGLVIDFSITYNIVQFIVGIFLGSLSWWMSVYFLALFLKKGISVELFQIIQYLIGTGILGLGFWTLLKAFM